jgi:sulfate permease, SulP family
MAFARLGDVIRFVPYPVTVGFTSGIALIIATGQIGDALGLSIEKLPPDFLHRMLAYGPLLGAVRPQAAAICAATVAIIQFWPRVTGRVPGPLVALLVTTAAVHVLGLPVETIHDRFAPRFRLRCRRSGCPRSTGSRCPRCSRPRSRSRCSRRSSRCSRRSSPMGRSGAGTARTRSCSARASRTSRRHCSAGSPPPARSRAPRPTCCTGGRTPVAGMVHALVLLAILLLAGDWAGWIPMATLAGILLVVAYNMSEWHVFVRLLRAPRSDVLVLIATFALTVAVNLTVAIQVGVVLASLLFMRRMAEVTQVKAVRDVLDYEISEPDERVPQAIPPGVGVFEINGSFCFGAARKFTEALLASHRPTPVVVLRMRHVLAIDATGLQALEDVAARLRKRGTRLLNAGVHAQPLIALERSGALERIGPENLFETFDQALDHAREIV